MKTGNQIVMLVASGQGVKCQLPVLIVNLIAGEHLALISLDKIIRKSNDLTLILFPDTKVIFPAAV